MYFFIFASCEPLRKDEKCIDIDVDAGILLNIYGIKDKKTSFWRGWKEMRMKKK